MRILLTGGTGLIGQALCHRWTTEGHMVTVWSRQPHAVSMQCSGARGVAQLADIDASNSPDVIVNLAGAPIADRRWSEARRKVLWQSRIDLTRTLVDWIESLHQRPQVLLSGSATGWYGDQGEQILDEDSPPGPTDFATELCQAWEQEALRAQSLGVRVVQLRTAPVLAAHGGMLKRLLTPFKLGLGGRLGNGQQWMPWIHVDDEIGLIDFLLHHTECSGAYNACAPEAVRNAEFTRELARALHRPACLPAPAGLLRLLLGDMSVLLLGSQRVVPKRALEAGYTFAFPNLPAALKNLL